MLTADLFGELHVSRRKAGTSPAGLLPLRRRAASFSRGFSSCWGLARYRGLAQVFPTGSRSQT